MDIRPIGTSSADVSEVDTHHADVRPLVLLDVDGVVNDLAGLARVQRPWAHTMVFSHGTWMQIPEFMPALVRHLVEHAEVWWCTEWEDSANDDLPAALRIAPLPVLRQPAEGVWPWKARSAHPLAADTISQGRQVFWIEDFGGEVPVGAMPPGTVFIDTDIPELRMPVLVPSMLPAALRPVHDEQHTPPTEPTQPTQPPQSPVRPS